eukprot:2651797-Pyramimonas_sp.AAC.1
MIANHDRDPPLRFGHQQAPDFNIGAPEGTGLSSCDFWCNDPACSLEEAFEVQVYVGGSSDPLQHPSHRA